MVGRLPDTVWTCCGGLLMIVFRLISTVVWLHGATLQMELLVSIDFRDGLLPYSDLLYYEVGNLNTTDSLPDYVTENYTGYSDNSNKDRIIVSFDPRRKRFENVYVTQHSDQVNFDQNHTYRISAELIEEIQDLSRE